jgi:hypothetical protein
MAESNNKQMVEWAFRILSLLLAIIIVPTFGWVWQTHSTNTALQLKVTQLEKDDVHDEVIGMGKDIEHINSDIADIKESLRRIEDAIK